MLTSLVLLDEKENKIKAYYGPSIMPVLLSVFLKYYIQNTDVIRMAEDKINEILNFAIEKTKEESQKYIDSAKITKITIQKIEKSDTGFILEVIFTNVLNQEYKSRLEIR